MRANLPKGMGGGAQNMQSMIRQAQKMQEDMAAKQEELDAREYDIKAGGGVVAVKINGKKEILSIEIDPEIVDPDDVETLQDILVAGVNEAIKRVEETNAKEMELLGLKDPISIYRPRGCQFCNNTGYKGRIAVHEIMYMNEDMRAAVSREKNLEVLRGLARKNGMVTLRDSCFELVAKGITSIQELMTVNAG